MQSNVWLGLNDLGNEETFTCPGGSQAPDNTTAFYEPDEPNNSGGIEHCVHFSSYADFLLNDSDCSNQCKFICEKNAIVEPDL